MADVKTYWIGGAKRHALDKRGAADERAIIEAFEAA